MSDSASLRSLSDGEVLFKEGDSADSAYIIESGRLEISTGSGERRVTLCELVTGDIVGEMGVIDSAPRTATAISRGETRLMVVTRDSLTERIAQADPILKLLVKILLDRYRSGLNQVRGNDPRIGDEEDLISADVVGEYVRHGIDKIRLEAELKESLNAERLNVLYQPLLNVAHNEVAGFEALTRWNHPTRGPISPGLFISLAEETSLIVPVGLFVFEQACRDLSRLRKADPHQERPLFMSINVSGRQISDPDFIRQAAEITKRFGVPPCDVKLEITESLAVEFDTTLKWMAMARELGFKVSLDDFGTGFSSLETLAKLPLDAAKVDQAFVRSLDNFRDRELLRGIVSLMRGLGLEIIVEGIETLEQLAFIHALDCDLAQGYLVGRPLDYDDARDTVVHGPPFLHTP